HRHAAAEHDPLHRPGHRPRRRGRRGDPRPAHEGRPALRPVGPGTARHPPGHRRRRDRPGHPRQEPPLRRVLRKPRPLDGAAGRRRPRPAPGTGGLRRRPRGDAVLGDRRRHGPDRRDPARDDRDDEDGDRLLPLRRRPDEHPRRDHRRPLGRFR
ncbi:hypothetical protein KR044_011367, partial [Drosophila immigrans]